ncbi:hypothetical protein O3M35_006103 [Rhynocoris fuscipes]|uniref:Protein kinase domain-containing protein n=1 Tax=Rhynocoris fuscipes TaxID=488301 RepID=A0AAW1DCX9_9HEMI
MSDDEDEDIPLVLLNPKNNNLFLREHELGSGKFGKCYQIRRSIPDGIFAVKIVSKDYKKWLRIRDEMRLHKELKHKNIVKFQEYFEDSKFAYIILELCHRTLHDLQKLRIRFSNSEYRFYMKQILDGLRYLHEDMLIIHGDLKLSNILINDNLVIKICDFGFATKLKHCNELRKPRGGTAGFSAPEIVCLKASGFSADIWSIGCITYTMLIGKKPFRASTKSEIRLKVSKCDYYLPAQLNKAAQELIVRTLWPDPIGLGNNGNIEDDA